MKRLLFALLFLLFASVASAQVTVDAVTSSGAHNGQSSYSFSHTSSGSNRYVIVTCSIGATSVSALTYNSLSMTNLGTVAGDDGSAHTEVWGYKAQATGSQTVAVTLSVGGDSICIASSFTAVDQTTPVGTTVCDGYTASGTSHSHNTTSQTNGLVWDGLTLAPGAGTITLNGGQTSQSTGSHTGGDVVVSTKAGAASVSTGASWVNDFYRWGHCTVPLIPTGGSGGTSKAGSTLRLIGK